MGSKIIFIGPPGEAGYNKLPSQHEALFSILLDKAKLKREEVTWLSPSMAHPDETKKSIASMKPSLIVPMGGDALELLTGQTEIMKLAGRPMNITLGEWTGKVYPTVHFAYILRNMAYTPKVYRHFEEIGMISRGEAPKRLPTNYIFLTDFSRIEKFFDQLEQQPVVAFDTETTGLNFVTSKIICFSFSWKERTGVVVPLYGYKCEKIWTDEQLHYILTRLQKAFSRPEISWVAHNMSFDHKVTRALGNQYPLLGPVDIAGTLHDTMLLQHLLDENATDLKGLKALADAYTDMGRYDDPLDDFKKQLRATKSKEKSAQKKELSKKKAFLKKVQEQSTVEEGEDAAIAQEEMDATNEMLDDLDGETLDISYDQIPTDILWPYAAMDADATYRIFMRHFAELKKQSEYYSQFALSEGLTMYRLYMSLVMPLRRVLDDMEFRGTTMDIAYLNALDVKYSQRIAEITAEFLSVPEVAKVEKLFLRKAKEKNAEKWAALKSTIAWQEYLKNKDAKGVDITARPPRPPKYLTGKDYADAVTKPVPFNLNSSAHLRAYLYDVLKCPVTATTKRTEKGELSTDHEVLESLKDYSGVSIILENRRISKLHGTYVRGSLAKVNDTYNRIHTSFNQHVTVTGRLSSSQPNFQNIPREDKDIKRAFVPSFPGWKILQLDYAQAEFRMWCQLSRDRDMLRDIKNGLDIHTQTASDFWGIPMSEVTKQQRTAAKFVVFGLMYGRGTASVAQQVGITKEEADTITQTFFERYPRAAAWLDSTKREVKKRLFVPGFFGRVRRLPYANSQVRGGENSADSAERQAVNSPIQGSAADITGIALIRIDKELKRTGLNQYAHLLLTVHDSIILEVAEDRLSEVVELCRKCMTEKLPGMVVPMVVDPEVGDNWGELIAWGKYCEIANSTSVRETSEV